MDSELSWEFIQRYDKALPRYTSYPTVPYWGELGPDDGVAALKRSSEKGGAISFYVHVPFCDRMCLYCGCNTTVIKRGEGIDEYLGALERELTLVREHLGERPLVQLHFGGGTPTMLSPAQLDGLVRGIFDRFPPRDDAEIGIEIDPVVTRKEHYQTVKALGFNRISIGVQDFDNEVQRIVARDQWADISDEAFQLARDAGFENVNLDLIYGLPGQTPEHLRKSAEHAIELGTDRVAVFGYAHVPWMKPHQKKLEMYGVPTARERWSMFEAARKTFEDAGYAPIGMDHFARHSDELVRAQKDGRLNRNFQGYTVLENMDLVGIGLSSISDVGGAFLQNAKRMSDYYKAIDAGQLSVIQGIKRSSEDDLRRDTIISLMCNLKVSYARVSQDYGIDFADHFSQEISELGPLVEDELAEVGDGEIRITERGRRLMRNIACLFDEYLRDTKGDTPRFSRAV